MMMANTYQERAEEKGDFNNVNVVSLHTMVGLSSYFTILSADHEEEDSTFFCNILIFHLLPGFCFHCVVVGCSLRSININNSNGSK